ncbi:MAG: hypothetical protein ABI537_16300 [Casimicrobiaceae bacterium]
MSESKQVRSGNENLASSLKLAVWAAVLGCVVLAVETPSLVQPPAEREALSYSAVPAPATPATDYFPAQFPAPKAEAEAAPATF